MKILVVMTGGTIGSVQVSDTIALDNARAYVLLDHYAQKHPDTDVEFETVVPFTTLSEQLSHNYLNQLIACIREHKDGGYGGIIVTHGTDTLQYTAAALNYVFGSHSLPIVLVASNRPLDDRRSNGHRNFEAAVSFIRCQSGRGTFVSYRNRDNVTRLHRGSRLLLHSEYGETILSLDRAPYAVCEDGVIIKNTAYRQGDSSKAIEDAVFAEGSAVLSIMSRPGEMYTYSLEGIKAVIIRPYHSGTLNTESEAFQKFCKRVGEKGIPLFMVDATEGAQYESTELFDELGLIVLPPCAFVPMYMKLWLANSIGVEDIKAFVLKPLAEEFLPERF